MRLSILMCALGVFWQGVVASVFELGGRSLSAVSRPSSNIASSFTRRQSTDGGDDDGNIDYLSEVCYGSQRDDDDTSGPKISTPCMAYEVVDFECQANGSAPIDFLAQQECICGSPAYFDMLFACNKCMEVHGASENDEYYDPAILSTASAAFCTGTPVTGFEDSLSAQFETVVTATATGTDLFPSETAVSLYYTGSIETNVGEVTGSATLAIASSGTWSAVFPESTGAGASSASIPVASVSGQTTRSTRTGSSSISTSVTGSQASSTSASSTANTTGSSGSEGKVVNVMLLQGLTAVAIGMAACMG